MRWWIKRLTVRRRLFVFLLVAIGVVVLPYGLFHTFEGMNIGGDGSTTIVQHPYNSSTTTALAERPQVTNTSSHAAASSSVSLSPSRRPDLPERKLTPYVNPLIGTEGKGHGSPVLRHQSNSQRMQAQQFHLEWLNQFLIVLGHGKIKPGSSTTNLE
jgi:hypothetical protein